MQRAHNTKLSGSVSQQGSPCRDTVPRHAGWFGSRQRLSLSRQIFVGPVSRQKFSVVIGFGAGPGLGRNKGLLVSR